MGSSGGEGSADARARTPPVQNSPTRSSAPGRFSLRIPADPDCLRRLRHELGDFLSARGVGDADAFDIVVAVSEAVANAIEHPVARTDTVVRVVAELRGDEVLVRVRDSGQWRSPGSTSAARGRGLLLIGALADLDVRTEPDGTTLTLRRRLTASDSAGDTLGG